jgi:hypothetical protein
MLALVGTGLVTALAAAEVGSSPDEGAMSRTIVQQKVADGQPPTAATVRDDKAISPDEMLADAERYEREMKQAIEHAETLRANARHSHDIIRMTCVDDRYGQMKQVWTIARPRFRTIPGLRADEFHMRAQFTVIRTGADRMAQLAAEIETCTGDSLDPGIAGRLEEEGRGPNGSVTDPTLPADPIVDLHRPEQASPYQ